MVVSKGKERSLLMCTTPLQMLIAEKIIDLNMNQEFDLLVLAPVDNDKYREYYRRLSLKCSVSHYFYVKSGLFGFWNFVKDWKYSKLEGLYSNYYLASIDSRRFQYILSKHNNPKVFTFDDGTANIFKSSVYYLGEKISIYRKMIWNLLGVKYYLEDIKNMSIMHYTIYNGLANITESKRFVSLFNEPLVNELIGNNESNTISIYLGQPLQECSSFFNINCIADYLMKLNVDFYFPHPREEIFPLGDFEIIDTKQIFEDYIVSYLSEFPNSHLKIYSFISSAVINVSSLPNVDVKYIYDDLFSELYGDFYQYVEKILGIKCIYLDKLN